MAFEDPRHPESDPGKKTSSRGRVLHFLRSTFLVGVVEGLK